MKKTILFALAFITSLIFMDSFHALDGYTTGTYISIRTEPNVNGTLVGQFITEHTKVDLVDDTLYNKNDPKCNLGWYKIKYNNNENYICGDYISIGEIPDDNPVHNPVKFTARISDVNVTVRPTPSYSNNPDYYLLPGTNVRILDKVNGSGCQDGWYKIEYYKNNVGYVCATYIKTKEELTATDTEYEKELKEAGFPDSYIPYLVKIHKDHPTWVFNPIKTNVDFNTLVRVETTKNYIHKQYLNSIVNPIYQLGASRESGWYVTTDEVNAFFLDPRNFLTETFIFMFERLNYDYESEDRTSLNKESKQTKFYYDVITNLLGSSYTNTDEYKYWFIDAGFKSNVSPVYLTSLSYQEGPASNENNPSIIGTHSVLYYEDGIGYPVNGYYNYFNIGAYNSGVNSPVTRGLAYACGPACTFNSSYGRPWDTREKAIYGGALWIGDGYIGNGQNTMYFKKFDSSPTSPSNLGSHQYQTNITAPCSESVKEYEAYKKTKIIDSNFTFDIPIYENMPEMVSLPEIASKVNTLKEIKIDGKLISGFDKDVIDYTVYISSSSETINIEVSKDDNNSKVTGIGQITLKEDTTEHQIIVTAENGNTKTYRIKIIKVIDTTSVEDIISNLSVKVTGSFMNHISPDTVVNTLTQSILKNSPTASVVIYNKNNVPINGASLIETGGSIKITAPNGETKTYTTVVNGDTNGDGTVTILDLLQVQKDILASSKLNAVSRHAADTNNDNKVDLLDLLRIQKYIKKQGSL